MPVKRTRNTKPLAAKPLAAKSLAAKSMELAIATPQVMAHRLTRMALAGPQLSERDRKEFQKMVVEKQVAFTQAWSAMARHAFAVNQAMAMSMLSAAAKPVKKKSAKGHAAALTTQMQSAALGVLAKGLDPVHRAATANAKRLAKTKLK